MHLEVVVLIFWMLRQDGDVVPYLVGMVVLCRAGSRSSLLFYA
jgi:hypothetical protein